MQLIDTHCHLTHGRLLPDVQGVLARARAAGVTAIICAAADVAESRASLGLARREKDVFALVGVHPHEAKDAADGYLNQLEELAGDARNVGIGEIGLDYHYDFSPRPAQQRVFAEQLDLARRLGKNVVVHTREAFEDTMAIIARSGVDGRKIVFHSFTENRDAACRALDLGATIGFSGIVTFVRSAELQQTALLVPADRILAETDAPYLSPEPVRKMKTNEPANVQHVSTFLARLRGVAPEEFARQITENAKRFFGLHESAGVR
jgi:TatD DNase family protein